MNSVQTTSTPSFLETIEQDALDVVHNLEKPIVDLWNYEAPIFVAELKNLAHELLSIAGDGVVTVLEAVASGSIQSTEALGALITHTYQTAVGRGLAATIADAQAAAKQVAAATAVMVATGKPPAQ